MQGIEIRPALAPMDDIRVGGGQGSATERKINRQPHGPSFDTSVQTTPEASFREVIKPEPGESDKDFANRIADILSGVSAGHHDIKIAPDFGIRVAGNEKHQPLPFALLQGVRDASGNFANFRMAEREFEIAKDRLGNWLKRLVNPFPTFRGGIFPSENTSATIEVESSPSVPESAVEDFIETAGAELQSVAKVHVIVDLTVSPEKAEIAIGRFGDVIEEIAGARELSGGIIRKYVEVTDWGKIAEMMRKNPTLAKFIQIVRNLRIGAKALQNTPQRTVPVSEIDPDTLPFVQEAPVGIKAD